MAENANLKVALWEFMHAVIEVLSYLDDYSEWEWEEARGDVIVGIGEANHGDSQSYFFLCTKHTSHLTLVIPHDFLAGQHFVGNSYKETEVDAVYIYSWE